MKEERREERKNKGQRIESNKVHINPTISTVTLNISGPYLPIKR